VSASRTTELLTASANIAAARMALISTGEYDLYNRLRVIHEAVRDRLVLEDDAAVALLPAVERPQ
jgi:hypothetical protein